MPLVSVHTFLEFFMYIILVKGKCRRSSLSLTYKPTDELHNFAIKVKFKLREMDGLPLCLTRATIMLSLFMQPVQHQTKEHPPVQNCAKPAF